MKEVVRVKLENEMDLILAHKRAMKLCELSGFSLIVQTSIATAVSEIARCAIEFGKNAELILGIEIAPTKQFLKAVIRDSKDFSPRCAEATHYAKRLVDEIEIIRSVKQTEIILKQMLRFPRGITDLKMNSFVDYFKREPPLSPYDELRRKNLLLQDLAEKIQKSENDFRILTDSLPLMMFAANSGGVITYFNKWVQDFLGQIPTQLNNTSWKNFIHKDDHSLFNKELTNAMVKQTMLEGQFRFKEKKSGEFLWHLVSVIPLKDEKQVITQWIGFIVDIDAQKRIEVTLKDNRELKETQDQLFENQAELQKKIIALNRSNYELEQFAHLASHDLQEPLRKIFFYSDTLNRKYAQTIDEGGIKTLNNMAKAAARMRDLINDLLSYSQLQNQKLIFEEVDLNILINEIINDMDDRIKEKNSKIDTNSLPSIKGNTLRLRQLFVNLISNSLKYSKPGIPPHIEINASKNNENVSIKVKDNGIGFDEKYREKIFGLFERLHTKDKFPGTGIGLSICKKIVELHHGTISAASQPGEYSIFDVTLPISQEIDPAPL